MANISYGKLSVTLEILQLQFFFLLFCRNMIFCCQQRISKMSGAGEQEKKECQQQRNEKCTQFICK